MEIEPLAFEHVQLFIMNLYMNLTIMIVNYLEKEPTNRPFFSTIKINISSSDCTLHQNIKLKFNKMLNAQLIRGTK